AEIGVLLRGHHENGFKLWCKAPIHHCHLKFVFIIGDSANASDNGLCPLTLCVVHEQPVKDVDLDVREAFFHDRFEHLAPLLDCKQWLLCRVRDDRHHDLIEQAARAFDDVDMSESERIEG